MELISEPGSAESARSGSPREGVSLPTTTSLTRLGRRVQRRMVRGWPNLLGLLGLFLVALGLVGLAIRMWVSALP